MCESKLLIGKMSARVLYVTYSNTHSSLSRFQVQSLRLLKFSRLIHLALQRPENPKSIQLFRPSCICKMQGAEIGREDCECLSVLTIKAMLFKALFNHL